MKGKFVIVSVLLALVLALSLVGCIPEGERGSRGTTGPQGLQGEQGIQGLPGPEGPKGDVGLQGEQGERGKQGYEGDEGDEGDRGLRGYTGATGAKGATGATGATGAAGPKGDKGDPGEPGADGTFPYVMQMGTLVVIDGQVIEFSPEFITIPLVFVNVAGCEGIPESGINAVATDIAIESFTIQLSWVQGWIGDWPVEVNWLAISQE